MSVNTYRFIGFSEYKVITSKNRGNDNQQLHRRKVTTHAGSDGATLFSSLPSMKARKLLTEVQMRTD